MPSKTLSFVEAKKLPGDGPFTVETVESDERRVNAITFVNADGTIAFRVKYQDYAIRIQVPAPPVMVKKTRITATNKDAAIELVEEIADSFNAKQRVRVLESAGFAVTSEEVEVPEAV